MTRNPIVALALLSVLSVALTSQAATLPGSAGDGKTSIVYDPATGVFGIQADGLSVGLFDVLSESGIFTANASLPADSLFLENHESRKSWAAFQEHAFNSDFVLGGVAPAGLGYVFLLNDLTLTGSGGLGTENRNLDLVYLGETPPLVPPVVHDVDLGDRLGRSSGIDHTFMSAAGDTRITWSNLAVSGPGTPLHAPVLSPDGTFSWTPHGSPLGLYNFEVTATNAGGSDVGRLSVNLIAPPVVPPPVIEPKPPLPEPVLPDPTEPWNPPGFVGRPSREQPVDPDGTVVLVPAEGPQFFGPFVEGPHVLPVEIVHRPFVWLTPDLQQLIDDAGLAVEVNYAPWHERLLHVAEDGTLKTIAWTGSEPFLIGTPVAGGVAIDDSSALAAYGTFHSFPPTVDYLARFNGTSSSDVFLTSTSLAMFSQLDTASELSTGIPEPATLALALAMFAAASSVRATKRRRTNGS